MATTTVFNSTALKLVPLVVEIESRNIKILNPTRKSLLQTVFISICVLLNLLDYIFPISEFFIKYFFRLEVKLLNALNKYGVTLYRLSIEECDRDYHRFVEILDIYERMLIEMRDRLESNRSNFEFKHYELLKQIVEQMKSIEATLDILSIPNMREVLLKRLNAA